jgi:trimeric autotransporter adhesin
LANGATASAFGANSIANDEAATALGAGATAGFANSMAIGAGASTSATNPVSIGTASNTYRMLGVASAASLAAQSGPTAFVTTDANGNLATSSFNPQSISTLQSQVSSLRSQLNIVDDRVKTVGARGAALAGLHPNPRAKGDNHVPVAVGAYRGQAAFAAGYFRHIGNQVMLSVGGSTTGNDWSANAGVSFSW